MKIAKLIVGVVAGGLLLLGGALSTEAYKVIDDATSTFVKSTFDYLIVCPSDGQIAEYRANVDAVSALFPVYNYENTLNGKRQAKVNLLLSDQMADYDISFFNPLRLVDGNYSADGLLLDEVAASRLGAKVGDNVTFPLGNASFSLPVAAVYAAVNYQTMSNGVAMATFTTAMSASFATKAPCYQLAFVAAKDKAKCATLLQDYIPMGQLQSFEDFKAQWDAQRPASGYTDEQWKSMVESNYESYKNNFLKNPHLNSVQDKAVYMAGVDDTVATRREQNQQRTLLFAILVPVGLAGGLIAFDFLGRKKDEMAKTSGKTKSALVKEIVLFDCIAVGIALAISLGGIAIYGAIRGAIYAQSLLLYSLPAIAALAPALPLGMVYARLVYGKAKQGE